MDTKRLSFLSLLPGILCLGVLGCGQKDPSSSNDYPDWVWQCSNESELQETQGMSAFPLPSEGLAKWSYRHFGGLELDAQDNLTPDDESFENVTMEKADYQGETAYMVEDTPTNKGKVTRNWLARRGARIARVHKEELYPHQSDEPAVAIDYFAGSVLSSLEGIDEHVGGFVRFSDEWASSPELTETLAYNREVTLDATGTEGDLGQEEVRVHRFKVESISETVTVPAGTFDGCITLKRERLREPTSNATENKRRGDIKRYWFCPGVGKVKEQEVVENPRTEELLYYCIPGGICCEE